MIVQDVINQLHDLAPLAYAEDFDNVGLLVSDKNQEVTGQKINEMGLGTCLGDISHVESHSFEKTFLSFLHDDHMKQNMSKQAQTLIDGKGAQRIADGILNHYGYN